MIRLSSKDSRTSVALRSIGVYLLSFGLFAFALFQTELGDRLNAAANRTVAAANVHLLGWLGVDASLDGTYIHTASFSVLIVDACNGAYALVYTIPACMCLPFSLRRRLLGCLIVTVVVCLVNQARLATEMVFGSLYPDHFATFEAIWFRLAYWSLVLTTLWIWATARRCPFETPHV